MNSKILPLEPIYSVWTGRASASASKKGSVTVEAAMAVPLLFLAIVSLLYLMETMAIQASVRCGLQAGGKRAADEASSTAVIMPYRIESDVVNSIGQDRLERSIISGGSGGIHCDKSRMSPRTGIGELVASYEIRVPLSIFGISPAKHEEKLRIKAWTGYEKQGFGRDDDDTVYVTETGLVYHRDYHCTHLELSIHMVLQSEIESLRNEGGGKYHPCQQCMKGAGGGVYITDTGDRYHSSLSCSGLKRTIYAVPLSEVAGKGACSRCGK
ncbi:TadE family protein [[Clostridium] scindens]|uniref:TadE family protein n=1 Tax=Clostridium scindens (strain JCM 10418 / VPI 12708) TaxID=29347 RepID=UPI0024330197|nr:TadE family protein [[Clostridium] scindens]